MEDELIRFYVKELLANKEFEEKRRITLDEVSRESRVSRNTLSRIVNTWGYSTTTENLDRLCKYFNCSLSDLASYVEED